MGTVTDTSTDTVCSPPNRGHGRTADFDVTVEHVVARKIHRRFGRPRGQRTDVADRHRNDRGLAACDAPRQSTKFAEQLRLVDQLHGQGAPRQAAVNGSAAIGIVQAARSKRSPLGAVNAAVPDRGRVGLRFRQRAIITNLEPAHRPFVKPNLIGPVISAVQTEPLPIFDLDDERSIRRRANDGRPRMPRRRRYDQIVPPNGDDPIWRRRYPAVAEAWATERPELQDTIGRNPHLGLRRSKVRKWEGQSQDHRAFVDRAESKRGDRNALLSQRHVGLRALRQLVSLRKRGIRGEGRGGREGTDDRKPMHRGGTVPRQS